MTDGLAVAIALALLGLVALYVDFCDRPSPSPFHKTYCLGR